MLSEILELDHIAINVKDNMDEAYQLFTQLGFILTPRGYHSLGSINHSMVFGNEQKMFVDYRPSPVDIYDPNGFYPNSGPSRKEMRSSGGFGEGRKPRSRTSQANIFLTKVVIIHCNSAIMCVYL